MTTDFPDAAHKDAAQANLAFLREVVEGDPRPGMWGFAATYLAIGLAVAVQIAATDYLPLPDWTALPGIVLVWSVYAVAQNWISRRVKTMGGARPLGGLRNRASGAAFIGMVLSHLVMLAVFVVLAIRMQDDLFLTLAALSFFSVQAAMWVVLHTLTRQGWQLLEALAWLVAAVGGAALVNTQYFAHWVFGAVLLLMVLPGALMLRAAKGGRS